MEHLSFLIWMLLYPVFSALADFLAAASRDINDEEPHSKEAKGGAALIMVIIYFSVGAILY